MEPVTVETVEQVNVEGLAPLLTPAEAASTDTWTVRLVVILLGCTALSIVIGSVVLALDGEAQLPDELLVLAGTAIGALGSLLASTRSTFTKR